MGLLVDWTGLRGKSPSMSISQYNLPKLKGKREKDRKNRTEYPRTVVQLQKV